MKTQKEYLKIVGANVVNRFGDSIDAIAFSWLMYEITGNASLMALMLACNILPTVILQPIAGVLVDRLDRRRIMVLCDIGRGAVVSLTAVAVLSGFTPLWLFFVSTVINSTLEALRMPAGVAITPRLLDSELFTVGSSFNQMIGRIFELAGTAAAGAVIAWLGSAGALLVDAATFYISAALVSWIRVEEPAAREKLTLTESMASFVEGFRYIRQSRILIGILVLGMFINAVTTPLSAFLTIYSGDYLRGGPQFLSLQQLVLIGGMALGAFLVPKLQRMGNKRMVVISALLCAAGMAAYFFIPMLSGISVRQILAVAVVALLGGAFGMLSAIMSASLMRHTDPALMGRVSGLTNAVLCAAMPVLSLLCSAAAVRVSVPGILLVFGILSLILGLCISRAGVYNEL